MITDHVITEILESDLIVADLTFLNPNVFYELGIAHSVEKPVIPIAHCETKLPFDNLGMRAVMFDPTDWHSQVEATVTAVLSLPKLPFWRTGDILAA